MVPFIARMNLALSVLMLVAMAGAMMFSSNDRVIAYTVGRAQIHDLHVTDVDHALTVTYPIVTRYLFDVNWSAQGNRLLVTKISPTSGGLGIDVLANGRWQAVSFDWIQEEAFAWSPDESYLVYTDKGTSTDYDLYRADPDGQHIERLFEMPGGEWHPTFSPDGRWIAFHSIVNTAEGSVQNALLYAVNTGEIQPIHPVADETTGMFSLSWSPDAQYIAYAIRFPDRQVKIAIRDIAAGTSRLLLPDLKEDYFAPEWSADGERIAFRTANHTYIVDVDGQNMTRITADYGHVEALKWSADGAYLSAVGEQGLGLSNERSNTLYVMDAAQPEHYQRLYTGVLTSMPVWQP